MKILLLILISVSLGACATSNGSKGVKSAKYTEGVTGKGLSGLSRRMSKKCPASQKKWKGMQWRQKIKLANACVKAKKWQKVEALGNHLAQKEHLAPWGGYYLSIAALNKKNYERAQWMIDLAIKKAPRQGLLQYQKGRIHWALNEFDKGIAAFNLALKNDSSLTDAHHFLGQVYFRDQNFKLAIKHFEEVLDKDSNNDIALMGAAESYSRLGSADKSVEFYGRAINQRPRHLGLRLKLAEVYENQQKDYASALQTYKRIKELKNKKKLNGNVVINIDDKIKALETTLGQNLPGKKLSSREPAAK